LGLDAEQARLLGLQTFLGASRLAAQSSEAAEVLRAQVTSKGGTTEQAILSMDASDVKAAVIKAIQAAAARSRELGNQLGKE
jgi:pyrroline-5-carboxylate reductase